MNDGSMNGWRTSFGINGRGVRRTFLLTCVEAGGRLGSRSPAVWREVARVNLPARRSGRAKRQSLRLMVFQGMRALVIQLERKSDIEKVSRNVAKAVKSITGEQSM
jgi:hypothetical protein